MVLNVKRSTRFYWACFAPCFLLLLIGCGGGSGGPEGPLGAVEGTVTLDDQPLTEGYIAFYLEETAGSAGAELDAEGKFKFADPIPVGTYQVFFTPPELPMPNDEASGKLASQESNIHFGYQDGESSGFVAEVTEKEGGNKFEFALTKAGPGGSR
jgi:hypothetical protein